MNKKWEPLPPREYDIVSDHGMGGVYLALVFAGAMILIASLFS